MAAHDASRDRLTLEMLDVYGADCPVPPAVWRRFTTDDADVDLILELREKASAPVLARNLLNLMRDRQPDMMIVSSFLVVSVTMSELVSGVLSLTSWQRLMQKVGTLSRARPRGRARGPRRRAHAACSRRAGRSRTSAGCAGSWRSSSAALGRRATPTRLKALFDVGARFASQSEDSPIRTVGLNRDVRPAVLESRVTVKADAAERVFEVDAKRITWAVVDSGIDQSNIAFLDAGGNPAGAGAAHHLRRASSAASTCPAP